MAYELSVLLVLGSSQSGFTQLGAQLISKTGALVGITVSSGFVEIGGGDYLWDYASFPDSHQGAVKFYNNLTYKASCSINPQEAEFVDVKTSSRLAPTSAGRTLDVAVTGEAGLDFDNIHDASGAHTLLNIVVPRITTVDGVTAGVTVTMYTGNTPQTGDSFARIGVSGAGLTNLGDTRLANLDATISSRTKPADTQARVTLVDTLTTYTGNTPQTGDAFARVGVSGAGLTNLGDSRIANLDATVSSRTKPADTQARVTLVDTVTTYTGNTPQTGDAFARLGVSGAGLTNLGDSRIANLDATVSSRTKPADTQARVTLVDTLTAYTGNTPQTGDAFARLGVSGAGLTNLGDTRIAHLDADVTSRTKPADTQARVTLVDTLTTYTGNTPQTGDSFARLGVSGAGLTNLGDTRIANLDATISSRTKPADTQARVTLVDTLTTNSDKTGYRLVPGSTVTTLVNQDKTGYALVPGSTVTTLLNQDKTGYALVSGVTVTTVYDKTGYSLASGVTVTTNYDKTGYSLIPGSTVTVATNQDKTGYALSASGLSAVAAPTDINTDAEARASFMSMMRGLFNRFFDRVDQTNARQTIYNDSGTAVSTRDTSDDGTTQTIGKTE